MRQRLLVRATLLVVASAGTRSAPGASHVATTDGPATITSVSTHGVGMISTWSDPAGHHADLGAWPEVGSYGCGFVYVDIDVREGGTLTGTYSVRQSPHSDSFLDIYLLEPGVTWDPGTTWNESGTERCFRWDFPPGVVRVTWPVDAWPPWVTGWETPDYELSVPLDDYAHQTVRVVFRQWSWGEVYDEAIQSRIRNLSIAGRLKLFLDADGNFDPASPDSDDADYVPGARLSDGASVALPQQIQVIAAFVDATGAITPPPSDEQVTFRLEAVSAFEGMAMNASDPRGSDFLPDVAIEGAATIGFGSDNTARVTLKIWDYAARGKVVAEFGSDTAELEIPKDVQPNGIPDVGWVAADLTPVADNFSDPGHDADSDPFGTDPNGQEIQGDGLGAIQEYRGFIVQGVHRRTNPQRKDLFIHTTHPLAIGDAVRLPVSLHLITAVEMSDFSGKMVNLRYRSGASEYPDLRPHDTTPFPTHQKALWVVEAGRNQQFPDATGLTMGGGLGPNSVQGAIEIYRDLIRLISPPNNNIISVDPFDEQKTNMTLAHEIGHGVAMPHWRKDTSNTSASCATVPLMPARALTVMVGCWFKQTKKLNDPKWNSIPHDYDQIDLNRLRIKR